MTRPVLERGVPFEGCGRAASNRVLPLDCPDGVGVPLTEVLAEHVPIEVGLLGLGRLLREPEFTKTLGLKNTFWIGRTGLDTTFHTI